MLPAEPVLQVPLRPGTFATVARTRLACGRPAAPSLIAEPQRKLRPVDEPGPTPRRLSEEEAGVLQALLAQDFPGVDELRLQSQDVLAQPGCGCGCGTIRLLPQDLGISPSGATSRVPAEGAVFDDRGNAVGGILLFIHHGRLAELEVYSWDEPLRMPSPNRARWFLSDR